VRPDFSIGLNTGQEQGWLFEETVLPPCALWIAGSGHIAQGVAPLAHQLDFDVTVFDDRPSLANTNYFPASTAFRVDAWDMLLQQPLPARPTFGLIVTRGHQHDALVLREWVQRPFAFLGMIGSSRKKRLIFNRFLEEKLATEEQLHRVECPVGLPIEAVSVHEIAVSIMAQLVQRRATVLKAA
jgi:xanthine dehydrogenase accessory factor